MKYIIIKIGIFFLNIIYFFIKLFTKTKNKITMISRQSNNINIDFKLLKNEILVHNKYKVVILCKTLDGKEDASFLSKLSYIPNLFKQMYHIAGSKTIILDSYSIAISILKHKKSLKVIQMWHSIGTMKKFGYDILDQEEGNSSKMAKVMNMHKNYDIVLSAGNGYKNDLVRQFNCDESSIRIIPLPRVDLLTDKEYQNELRNKIYDKYNNLKNKKNILYCPTFRKEETNLEKHLNELISKIDYSKYNLIVKLHPLSKIKINNKNIKDYKGFSSIEMASVCDYVITDYSCILYEVGILNKALYFYPFDYDEYNKNRSLNIDMFNDLPGVVSRNIDDIISSIEHNKYDYNELKQFIKKYVEIKGKSTPKIYELIENINK